MQPYTTMETVTFLSFLVTNFIIIKNNEETWEPLILPSKQRLVS